MKHNNTVFSPSLKLIPRHKFKSLAKILEKLTHHKKQSQTKLIHHPLRQPRPIQTINKSLTLRKRIHRVRVTLINILYIIVDDVPFFALLVYPLMIQ